MFRHVVMFQWTDETTASDRAAAVQALRAFGDDVADLGRLSVGADAGVSAGNYDAVVVVDFATREDYRSYANDPRHIAVIETSIKPHLAARAAVQTDLP